MTMKISFIAIAAAAVVACSSVAFAQNQAKSTAPGQQMLQKGPAPGSPGASGYAPGHLKKHAVRRHTPRHLARTSTHRQPAGMVQQKPMAKSGTTKSETTGMAPATTTTNQKKTDKQ
jgi:hypothetical protein